MYAQLAMLHEHSTNHISLTTCMSKHCLEMDWVGSYTDDPINHRTLQNTLRLLVDIHVLLVSAIIDVSLDPESR